VERVQALRPYATRIIIKYNNILYVVYCKSRKRELKAKNEDSVYKGLVYKGLVYKGLVL
jgi:hypothetical protein